MRRLIKLVVTLLFLPIALYQFTYLISWIAAEPIEEIHSSNLEYETIPEGANSFIVNHGSAIFSSHGTIGEEPLKFVGFLVVLIFSFLVYGVIYNNV